MSVNLHPPKDGGLLFVLGSMRSGTTHLRTVLHASRQIWMPDETQVLHHWLEQLDSVDGRLKPHDRRLAIKYVGRSVARRRQWRTEAAPSADDVMEHLEQTPVAGLDELFRELLRFEARCAGIDDDVMLADKSPQNTPIARRLSELFPDAKFLCIVRDPRDVVNSLKEVEFGPSRTITAASYWQRDATAIRELHSAAPERTIILRYEDLLLDREHWTRQLTEFLGIRDSEEMLQPWRHASATVSASELAEHHANLATRVDPAQQVAKWSRQRGLRATVEQSLVELVTADMLAYFGYPRRVSGSSQFASQTRGGISAASTVVRHLRRIARRLMVGAATRLVSAKGARALLRGVVARRPGCAPLSERPLDLSPGATAMIRAKNEVGNVRAVLDSIRGCFTEIVFVDNGSTDGTIDAVQSWSAENPGENVRAYSYPHSIARCGPEHEATDPSSPTSLVTYYNWCLAKCRTEFVVKWDMDMVAMRLHGPLSSFLLPRSWPVGVANIAGLTVYITQDGTALADDSAVFAEPRVFPNHPLVYYEKGAHWEVINLPRLTQRRKTDLGVVFLEVKRASMDELDHWSGRLDDLPTPRKRREFEVLSSLARGRIPEELRPVDPYTAEGRALSDMGLFAVD